jgi:hypothetical protein
MLPLGVLLVIPIWLFGLMYLFHLDVWEARSLIFVNWALNAVAKVVLVAALLAYVGTDWLEDVLENRSPSAKVQAAVKKLGGNCAVAGPDELNPPVIRVDLSGKRVSDDNLPPLEVFTQLRELDLSNTQIGDASLAKLKGLKQLQQLRLTGTKVTDAGVKNLQSALPRLKVIR